VTGRVAGGPGSSGLLLIWSCSWLGHLVDNFDLWLVRLLVVGSWLLAQDLSHNSVSQKSPKNSSEAQDPSHLFLYL